MDSFKDNRMRIISIAVLILIGLVYIFFASSKLIFPPEIMSKDSVAHIGEPNDYMEGHAFTLISVTYSAEQEMMEVVVEFSNTTNDGVNDYYSKAFALGRTGKSKECQVKEIMNEKLLAVYRIEGLKKYYEVELLFAPMVAEINAITDGETAHAWLNKYNVKTGHIDTSKTKMDYLLDRLAIVISGYTKDLKTKNDEIKEHQTAIKALEEDSVKLTESMDYLTAEEAADATSQIENNTAEALTLSEEIASLTKEADSLAAKIAAADTQLAELQKAEAEGTADTKDT